MRVLGSQRRRLAIVHGPAGIGKSALLAEYFRFARAPGRIFAAVQVCSSWRHRMAFISLRALTDCEAEGREGAASDSEAVAARALTAILAAVAELLPPQPSLASAAAANIGGADQGRCCLVVDHADPHLGWRDTLGARLLAENPSLCLLLARRSPLYRLEGADSLGGDRWKPVNLGLPPLSALCAARVCLRRVHRPLTEGDFSRGVTGAAAAMPLGPAVLLPRLAQHPALVACQGNPRMVVRVASAITPELPSLLNLEASEEAT